MQTKIKVDPVGDIITTQKGFIRQFLAIDGTGGKSVVKVFSKTADKLNINTGAEIVVKCDDFCFLPA